MIYELVVKDDDGFELNPKIFTSPKSVCEFFVDF